jgi:hypothetical protein
MNKLKMFGLAAFAASIAMALVGASSASASMTTLCTEDGTGCGVTHVHETSVGKAKLLSSLPTIECTALFLGDATSGEGTPLVINGTFTYSSCNNFCSVAEVKGTKAEIKVLRTESELASVTGKGEVHVECPFINCTYDGEGLEGMAKGPLNEAEGSKTPNGSVVISKQKTHIVFGSCPEEAFLDITTTPLSATYIKGEEGAIYCVEFEHAHGLYSDNKCKQELAGRTGQFELVVAAVGLSVGTVTCTNFGTTQGFLYQNAVCTEDVKNNTATYEKGKILP